MPVWNADSLKKLRPTIVFILLLNGCSLKPTYIESTCDYLERPEKYEGVDVQFSSIISPRETRISAYCNGYRTLSLPLEWADKPLLPEDDVHGGTIKGRILRKPDGSWYILGIDYTPGAPMKL